MRWLVWRSATTTTRSFMLITAVLFGVCLPALGSSSRRSFLVPLSSSFSSRSSSLTAVHFKDFPADGRSGSSGSGSGTTSSSSGSGSGRNRLNLPTSSSSSTTTSGATTTDSTLSRGGSLRPAPPRRGATAVVETTTATPSRRSRSRRTAVSSKLTHTKATEATTTSTATNTKGTAGSPILAAEETKPIKKNGGLFRGFRQKKTNYETYATKLKNRNATNLRRKVLHCTWGLLFAALHHLVPRPIFLTGMCVLSTGTLTMELLRYKAGFQWMNDILHLTLGSSLRKHEMQGKFTGSFYFFIGVTVTAALFDRNAATLGICQLALADPSASYFGRATRHVYWSRIENGLGGIGRNKGVLGLLGGALFCFPFNYRVLSMAQYVVVVSNDLGAQPTAATRLPGGKWAVAVASLALGFAGALADLSVPSPAVVLPPKLWGIRVPPLHLDDNFVVPLVSAYACQKVFGALHWNLASVQLGRYLLFRKLPSSKWPLATWTGTAFGKRGARSNIVPPPTASSAVPHLPSILVP